MLKAYDIAFTQENELPRAPDISELHWYGEVSKGELRPSRMRDFTMALSPFEGKKIHIYLETGNRRSQQHNRYYFGALRWLSMETGYDIEELHELCKRECNTHVRFVLNKKTGELIEKVFGGSTRRMKISDFAQYVENVKRYWSENGYVIPDEFWKECNLNKGE